VLRKIFGAFWAFLSRTFGKNFVAFGKIILAKFFLGFAMFG
jgi:hypothetical protein